MIRLGTLASVLLASLMAGSSATHAGSHTVLIAGDIAAGTSTSKDAETARLIEVHRGIVMSAGDSAYVSGTFGEYQSHYARTWGRFWSRTRPTPGNHDSETPGAAGSFEYFGDRAEPEGRGYYSFKVGTLCCISVGIA